MRNSWFNLLKTPNRFSLPRTGDGDARRRFPLITDVAAVFRQEREQRRWCPRQIWKWNTKRTGRGSNVAKTSLNNNYPHGKRGPTSQKQVSTQQKPRYVREKKSCIIEKFLVYRLCESLKLFLSLAIGLHSQKQRESTSASPAPRALSPTAFFPNAGKECCCQFWLKFNLFSHQRCIEFTFDLRK